MIMAILNETNKKMVGGVQYILILVTHRHGLPDETWHEPNPVDPLSLIDQVKDFVTFKRDTKICSAIFSGGVGVGLQLLSLAHQEEPRRLCA